MNEQSYEAQVEALERRWADRIDHLAANATANATQESDDDPDFVRDCVKDSVERVLFDSPEWEHVQATDVSDIAYEAANRAWDAR